MSSHYTTEPNPTASVLVHTTAGPIQISLFASQTPLACRNFVQHLLDGYYDSTAFHRVVPGFVIQGGDPTGTGEGGESIYEDREFETDARTGEKVVFGDELHSRLRFNRRGLVGMAKMGESATAYGSQFFITLADVRAQLDGKCTMFGRVEGDGIYNVVRIAEAENVEGTERPIYPFKITGAEVLDMPKGEPWESMKKRERVAKRTAPHHHAGMEEGKAKKKAKTNKKGKALLSFGDEAGDDDIRLARPPKAKFNTTVIESTAKEDDVASDGHPGSGSDRARIQPAQHPPVNQSQDRHKENVPKEKTSRRRPSSPLPPSHSPPSRSIPNSRSPQAHRREPSMPNPFVQLPLKDLESPSPSRSRSRSGTVSPKVPLKPSTSSLNAEIAALKASMRRNATAAPEKAVKKSALEQLIPPTSIRGRKRPRPGENGSGAGIDNDSRALQMLNAFKARLEGADRGERSGGSPGSKVTRNGVNGDSEPPPQSDKHGREKEDAEEESLCDLHFIANCQSCSKWDHPSDPAHPDSAAAAAAAADDDDAVGPGWMTHALSFDKDRLGKDLSWRRKNEEELVVIDPREKERHIQGNSKRERAKGKQREWGGRGR